MASEEEQGQKGNWMGERGSREDTGQKTGGDQWTGGTIHKTDHPCQRDGSQKEGREGEKGLR